MNHRPFLHQAAKKSWQWASAVQQILFKNLRRFNFTNFELTIAHPYDLTKVYNNQNVEIHSNRGL